MTTSTLDQKIAEYEAAYCTGEGNVMTGDDAVRWGENVLHSTYWTGQKKIMRSVFDNRQTVVRSCNASGKTYVLSDIVLAFLLNMSPSIVVTTAPTFKQVKDVLWAQIREKWDKHLIELMGGLQCLQTRLEIAPGHFAIGISPDKGVSFQGFHSKNVLIAFDEAPGVKPEIVRGARTLMAGGNVHTVWIGNPLEAEGHFFDAFQKGNWNRIHIHHKDTPNFTGEDIPQRIKDELISKEWVEDLKETAGEDSPLYQSGANGDFPDADSKHIISLKLAREAVEREVVAEGPIDMGIDCGGGGDLTVYTLKRGNVIEKIITESTPDVMQIPYKAVQLHKQFDFRFINVDMGGLGHGVVNRMEELGLPVNGIHFGGTANDDAQYANKRTEMAYNLKDWLSYGKIPDDNMLIGDMTSVRLLTGTSGMVKLTPKGQLQLEPKSETKKRLHRSPDRFDSAGLAVDQTSGATGPGIY